MTEITDMMIFTGNANPQLALLVSNYLNLSMGKITVAKFSDGETMVQIEENVRGKDIFVLQSICSPVNDNLVELLIITDALRRASAGKITAVIPYMGYARQDRRPRSARVPITVKLMANMITVAGVDKVLTVDLHADQIQGFFDVPLDNVYASPVLLGDIWKHEYPAVVVVSPDVGGVLRARALAKRLDDAGLAIIDKRRPQPNASEVMNIIGDVSGKTCIIVDDLVDTAGTLCNAAAALKAHDAIKVIAYCTHPVLSGNAAQNVALSALDELVVTDTIPLRADAVTCRKIRRLSVAELVAESIRRVHAGESLSSMFTD